MSTAAPLVEVTFLAAGKVISSEQFNSKTSTDPNFVSEEAKVSNTSYQFSGRHDHGNLALLSTASDSSDDSKVSHYGRLISSLQEAKMSSDAVITSFMNANGVALNSSKDDLIDEVSSSTVDDDHGAKHPPKKMKKSK